MYERVMKVTKARKYLRKHKEEARQRDFELLSRAKVTTVPWSWYGTLQYDSVRGELHVAR